MFIEPENSIVVESDAFEHSIAVEQTMVEYGNLRLGLVVEVSVDVDFEVHSLLGSNLVG
jgi:hypothetical protein